MRLQIEEEEEGQEEEEEEGQEEEEEEKQEKELWVSGNPLE